MTLAAGDATSDDFQRPQTTATKAGSSIVTMADSDSSSNDSDDDFLTVTDSGNKNVDREALVRKKLLESFYGKSAVAAAKPDSVDSQDTDFDALNEDDSPRKLGSQSFDLVGDMNDLDSPSFDAQEHTKRHVYGSSVQNLLETEERLALQVRTLDSTMQTLVYENYSRFIDATDAIKSIGVNVQANEQGLDRLTGGMQTIDEQSRAVEDALGTLRDQVAEKIRVKRLLTRLDALLKLPETLQGQIAAGKYRAATRSYLSASNILSKHSSEGFESLKRIETECNSILTELRKDLKRKILHWSGRLTRVGQYDESSLNGGDDDNDEGDDENIPHPPKNMTEIFECAGTLFILLQDSTDSSATGEIQESELDADDLQSMAVSASMRLLDRLLDTHLIEVQERQFSSPGLDEGGLDMKLGVSLDQVDVPAKGSCFIPLDFLDAILEAATLFGMSFRNDGSGGGYLVEFVSEAFASGLSHVRSILLEESIQISSDEVNLEDRETPEDEGQESAYEEITGALRILIQSVRELASGLALPEVGMDPEFAFGLVEQATELTESMVRRRVDQKFYDLRLNVVQNCLIPFATRTVEERSDTSSDKGSGLSQIVQIASMTLSDCLQLVDDTVRSVFSGGSVMGDSGATSTDLPILKAAVESSTRRFAFWLASSLEILAGGESSDPKDIIEASLDIVDEDKYEDFDGKESDTVTTMNDDLANMPGQDDTKVRDLVDRALQGLLSGDESIGANAVHSDLILAIVEMCRLAERSVAENLDQSILTHLGGGKKKSKSLFPSSASSPRGKGSDLEDEISKRFELASSRVLVLYATNHGSMAANILCFDLGSMRTPEAPRQATLQVLSIAKTVAIECAEIFGEKKRAGPVPVMKEDPIAGLSSGVGRKSGLQLDVERMFKENVSIYPHPSEIMEFSRNGTLFLMFKVAFRALLEETRMSSFTADAYRQLQVDAEFLKHMIPHYMSSEFTVNGGSACTSLSNLMGDVITSAGERCTDESCSENDDLLYESRETVRAFLARAEPATTNAYVLNED